MNASGPVTMEPNGDAFFADKGIVHVVRQYLPNVGGLEDVVRNLAAQQKGRFAGLKVVTLDRLFVDPATVLPRHEIIEGVDVYRIPYRGSSRYPIATGIFKEIAGADLVHVHAVDFFFDALALTRLFHGRTLVATTHGGFFHTRKLAALKHVWFNTLTRLSAQHYAAIACCSKADLAQFNRVAPARSRLIENGVSIEKFQSSASSTPRKRLLALGRFSINKRLDRLIEVLARLTAVDPEWFLDIAGMESDLGREDLLNLANQHGVADNIAIYVGLPDAALRELIGTCSFFVSASEHEGFGLALIEALSAGLMPFVHENEAFVSLADRLPLVTTLDYADSDTAATALLDGFQRLADDLSLKMKAVASVEAFSWAAKAREYDQMYLEVLTGAASSAA